jgi:hypothetical protein
MKCPTEMTRIIDCNTETCPFMKKTVFGLSMPVVLAIIGGIVLLFIVLIIVSLSGGGSPEKVKEVSENVIKGGSIFDFLNKY